MSDIHIDDNEEMLLQMFNSIFKYFITNQIHSLTTFSNEFVLKDALFSIEPYLAKETEIDLSTDTDYGLRYGNFVSIIDLIDTYLSNHHEKSTFTSYANFKSRINISSLMKNDKSQLILIAEMLIFISSISSNKDFLDLLENCNEDILSLYLTISEKYSKKYDDCNFSNTNTNSNSNSNNANVLTKSSLIYYNDDDSNSNIRHSLLRKQTNSNDANNNIHSNNNNNSNAINTYIKLNEELSRDLNDKTNEYLLLQKNYIDLEAKYKECTLQLQLIQSNTINDNTLLQDDLLNEKTNNMQLSNQIQELKMMNDNIRKDYEEKVKTLTFKLSIMNDKAIANEEKIESFKAMTKENEKLKTKLKGLSALTEKEAAIAEMSKNIEAKTRLIETLSRDKDGLNEKIAQLQKELYQYKDDIREHDRQRAILEKEIEELKKENKRLDMIMKSSNCNNDNAMSLSMALGLHNSGNGTNNLRSSILSGMGTNLAQIGQMSYENDIEDLNKKLDEKDKDIDILKSKLAECANEVIALKSEQQIFADSKDTLYLENEKIQNELLKEKLERQKEEIAYENTIKQMQIEVNDLKLNNNNCDYIGGNTHSNSLRNHKKNASIAGSFVPLSSNALGSDGGVKEIANLKSEIAKKNELILALQNKIIAYENDNDNAFFSQFQDSNDNGDGNGNKKGDSQKNYDELKQRVNREYELMSSSFYELAIQFMNLKSEVNGSNNKNKMTGNSNNSNKTWLELERGKNFP